MIRVEEMEPIIIKNMSLKQIADSGQCFRWRELAEGLYLIIAMDRCLFAAQAGEEFRFSCSREEFDRIWRDYFDLDRDYGAVRARISPDDPYLRCAAEYGWGIRILRQDLWEVMVSFLISQNNNIGRIKNSIGGLCRRYGKPISADGHNLDLPDGFRLPELFAFPTPEALSGASETDFLALGLGYRAKYLKHLAESLSCGGLSALRRRLERADDGTAREILMSYYGIGRKVADCICLFGLHRDNMFPADTHINKILAKHYKDGFLYEQYQDALGIFQQYLFYYDLKGVGKE